MPRQPIVAVLASLPVMPTLGTFWVWLASKNASEYATDEKNTDAQCKNCTKHGRVSIDWFLHKPCSQRNQNAEEKPNGES